MSSAWLSQGRGVVSVAPSNPELVLTGTWVLDPGATEAPAGQINIVSPGTATRADISLATIPGKEYTLKFNVASSVVSVAVGVAKGGTSILATLTAALGQRSLTFVATSATTWLRFSKTAASTCVMTAISVKKS